MTKRALVTGGAGFIGHHLIGYILENTNMDVVCLDRLDFSGNYNRLNEIIRAEHQHRVTIVWHDLRAEINPMISRQIGDVDLIFHLAASSSVDRSIEDPLLFIADNVVGTANLLQWARSKKASCIVYFSTDEVFGSAPGNVKFKEYDRYNSSNPYSASKAAAEEICVSFANTYGLPVLITHTMNVVGERQDPEKYLPLCVQRLRDGIKIDIHCDVAGGNPGSRYYIDVRDVCSAVMFLANRYELLDKTDDLGIAACPKINIAGMREVDNLALAKIVADELGLTLKHELVYSNDHRPGHDLRYALDGSRLAELGWHHDNPIEDSIARLARWYWNNQQWLL